MNQCWKLHRLRESAAFSSGCSGTRLSSHHASQRGLEGDDGTAKRLMCAQGSKSQGGWMVDSAQTAKAGMLLPNCKLLPNRKRTLCWQHGCWIGGEFGQLEKMLLLKRRDGSGADRTAKPQPRPSDRWCGPVSRGTEYKRRQSLRPKTPKRPKKSWLCLAATQNDLPLHCHSLADASSNQE